MRNVGETAMRTVKVEKTKLIETLKTNREKHQREFEEAMDGYWIEFKRILGVIQKHVDNKTATTDHHNIRLTRPENHVKEYDRAIQMMEWEVEKEIILSVNDFNCYVLDEWDWQGIFKHLHNNYSATRGTH